MSQAGMTEQESRVGEIARVLATYLAADTARELAGRTLPPVIEELTLNPDDWVVEGAPVEVTVRVSNADHVALEIPGERSPRILPTGGDHVVCSVFRAGPIQVIARNALNADHPVTAVAHLQVLPIPDVNNLVPGAPTIQLRGLSRDQIESLVVALAGARQIGLEIDPLSRTSQGPPSVATQAGRENTATPLDDLVDRMQEIAAEGRDLLTAASTVGAPPAGLGTALNSLSVRQLLQDARRARP